MSHIKQHARLAGPASLILLAAATLCAQQQPEEAPTPAVMVRVRLPIAGAADQLYQGVLQRAIDKLAKESGPGRRGVLVLWLDPQTPKQGEAPFGQGAEFERVLGLARFLASDSAQGVKTVAYIPETIKGHGVLLALACEEIVMAPDAELGEAGIDEDPRRPIERGIESLYVQIADARRTAPEAIVRGMLDRRLEVLRVETEDGPRYVTSDELPGLEETETVVSKKALFLAGTLGSVTGREAFEYGFATLAPDRESLARALRVPAESLEEDQTLIDSWRPVVIDIQGPITRRLARQVQTLIGTELEQSRVNWIALRISSAGGDIAAGAELASSLAELDSSQVRTVAYVPREALGPAALAALACDQLVMQPDAQIGGVDADQAEGPQPGPPPRRPDRRRPGMFGGPQGPEQAAQQEQSLQAAVAAVRRGLSKRTDQPWSLLAATIDPNLAVYRYTNRESGQTRLFCEAEAAEQPDAPQWIQGEAITTPGKPLRLDAARAQELGVAWRTVDTFDGLKQLYGFQGELRVARPNWALELVEALASPGLAALLLLVACVGAYIELHSPGMGIGGFLAIVALSLFFWSKYLDGTAQWLEAMLLLMGLCFILLEVFVLPGLGVFGLGGGAMVLAALVLMSQTFVLPQTASQLAELRTSMATVAGAGLGTIIVAFALRSYLPQSPLFRRMLLQPLAEEELAEIDQREQQVDYAYLVGATGTAATNLMPTGRAEIGGELVDVIADGQIIDRGAKVEVVSARANRVLVRRVG
ncbi:hypothetical protein Pla175_48170 [Pirellulimonas nuda]|uniref:Uncharacterized protein n=1 Tax=Pirellulimonas nuda TaxID=2528009 RepID=A0A518DIT8_9BACT|nr:NfeD family protein [Pirellulimonas nuda]QDU91395.1 hypothetical protein Pla175_48170 [Pirellulimonas nuda]